MVDVESIRRVLAEHGQSHLLGCLDDLDAAGQTALIEQIAAMDFDELAELIARYVTSPAPTKPAENIAPPQILPAKPVDDAQADLYARARQRGRELIEEGKVAALVVAGGQGTRLGYAGPKGCLEATPVTRKALFQVFAEQILAASRRAGRSIPWYVMTSAMNDEATRAYFAERNCFGLDPSDVFFFTQGTMPVIALDGKLLLSARGELATSPDGHGGVLPALRRTGALSDMAARGVELISYFQVDNPLVRCIDPLFLGLHDLHQAQMSAKALPKRDPMEKLGNFCLVDGKMTVIEYSDMPEDLARATTDDGHLRFWAGSIAIHVISRSFVESLTEQGRCQLPFHRAEKKVPFVDGSGRLVEPDKPNAVKLEMFVFDALPLAETALVLETSRTHEFSPIKNAQGEDSPVTSLHDQVRRGAIWIEEAGVPVPRDADGQIAAAIEISPLFADSPEQLAERIDANLVLSPGKELYLGPEQGGP